MILNPISYIRPTKFDNIDVTAAFSTDVSDNSIHADMGINTLTPTDQTAVNRSNLLLQNKLVPESLCYLKQVHGNTVVFADKPGLLGEGDGLITNQCNLTLGIMVADCAAVLLADTDAGIIGALHAGWRGAAGNIVPKGVEMMQSAGARNIKAWISPCIGTHAFEVGHEVATQFPSAYVLYDTYDKPRVDLQAFLVFQLIQHGVKPTSIQADERCTYTDTRFFSYRRQGRKSGRMMAIIALGA